MSDSDRGQHRGISQRDKWKLEDPHHADVEPETSTGGTNWRLYIGLTVVVGLVVLGLVTGYIHL